MRYCLGKPVMKWGWGSASPPLIVLRPSESPNHTRWSTPQGFLLCFIPNTWVVPAILWAFEKCLTNGDMTVTQC